MKKLPIKNLMYISLTILLVIFMIIFSFILLEKRKQHYVNSSIFMDKKFHQILYGENCENVSNIVKNSASNIEEIISQDFYGSDVEKINNSNCKWVKVDKITIDLIQKLMNISYRTYGIFNPLYSKSGEFQNINCKNIQIDEQNGRIKLEKDDVLISLNDAIEGLVCNKAIEIYKKERINKAIVQVGDTIGYLNNDDGEIKNGFVSKCEDSHIINSKTGELVENKSKFKFYHPSDAVISCILSRICSISDEFNVKNILSFFV